MQFILMTLVLFATLLTGRGEERSFDWSQLAEGNVPTNYVSMLAGKGEPGQWRVLMDDVPSLLGTVTANAKSPRKAVIAQISRQLADERYPILLPTTEEYGDFTLTVRFKTVSGVMEQMAGMAFRIQDERNYYYIRASTKGSTFRFAKVVDGVRSDPIGPEVEIAPQVWHEMKIQCDGNHIRSWLDGKDLLPTLTDTSFRQGKIGFWTKSDSVSYFTDLHIQYTPREALGRILIKEMRERHPRLLGMRLYALGEDNIAVVKASSVESEVGMKGTQAERDALISDHMFFGKGKTNIIVTMPLHDRNGEVAAAVRLEMVPFPGQTKETSISRAIPIVKEMSARIQNAKDLF